MILLGCSACIASGVYGYGIDGCIAPVLANGVGCPYW